MPGYTKAERIAKKVLNGGDVHIEQQHARESAWNSLKPGEEERFNEFIKRYMASLENKFIGDRVNFIHGMLRRHHFRPIEDITHESLESAVDSEGRLKPTQKFYMTFQDRQIVAVQVGRLPYEEGANIAAAHIDSPGLVGRIRKIRQDFNMAYMLCAPRGGLDPRDYCNVPLSMFYHGTVSHPKKPPMIIDFSLGDYNGEPKFSVRQESYHLDPQGTTEIDQLRVILGNIPFKGDNNIMRNYVLNAMLHLGSHVPKGYTLTEKDLNNAEIWFVPSQKPYVEGVDRSMIGAYGQDNWACAFPLLYGFLNAKTPLYTKMLVLYDKEEIGDTGRGSLKTNVFRDIVLESLSNLLKKSLSKHYTALKNSWSMFCDVLEPVQAFNPANQDIYDSAYAGSGIALMPFSGSAGNFQGDESSPEMRAAICRLFEEKNIAYQLAMMGTHAEPTAGSSDIFHQDIYTEGIDVGVPVQGLHRHTECASKVDLWNMAKAAQVFFGVHDHSSYMPRER